MARRKFAIAVTLMLLLPLAAHAGDSNVAGSAAAKMAFGMIARYTCGFTGTASMIFGSLNAFLGVILAPSQIGCGVSEQCDQPNLTNPHIPGQCTH